MIENLLLYRIVLFCIVLALPVFPFILHRLGANPHLANVAIGFSGMLIVLVAAECFATFVCRSNNVGYTLAYKNWVNEYEHLNEQGFRDEDFTQKDTLKKILLFIGDSFTEGQGIEDTGMRYSNIVAGALGDSFTTFNLAKGGANDQYKWERLRTFPRVPDLIVYQYFMDDIMDAAALVGLPGPIVEPPYVTYTRPLPQLIENSYLLNYLYWQLPHNEFADYQKCLNRANIDSAAQKQHFMFLDSICSYSKDHNVRLLVLIMPHIPDPNFSAPLLKPTVDYFKGSGVQLVEVTPFLAAVPVEDRIVNVNDYHLNSRMQPVVANSLLRAIANR
jgi:hypothetical protein